MPPNDAPRSPMPLYALLATLAALAAGIAGALRAPAARTGFDLDQAMSAAGAQVPAHIESFYFFVPEAHKARDTEVGELATLLARAAAERDYIGLAGADSARNLEELLAALETPETKNLNGLVLVYLGPEEHRERIETAMAASGAVVRFVIYPLPSSPAADSI